MWLKFLPVFQEAETSAMTRTSRLRSVAAATSKRVRSVVASLQVTKRSKLQLYGEYNTRGKQR